MLDTPADAQPDLRPGLMLCAYEPDLAWGADGTDADSDWTPPGARLIPVKAEAPESLARTLMERLRDPACRAALLVGRADGAGDFLIQTRAENRVLNGKARLVPTGPGVARATAPALEMAQTLSSTVSAGVLIGIATVLSGPLYDSYGAGGYLAMAGMAALGGLAALSLRRRLGSGRAGAGQG